MSLVDNQIELFTKKFLKSFPKDMVPLRFKWSPLEFNCSFCMSLCCG